MRPLRLIFLSALLLAACAGTPLPPGCEHLGRHGAVCLLPPASLPALDGSRLVTVNRDGQEQSFMGLLHVDDKDFRLAGLSLFGTSLFTLHYDGRDLSALPADQTRYLTQLAVMLELTLADPAALTPRLQGLDLKTGTQDGNETRDLYEDGRLVVHIERSLGPLADASLRIEVPAYKLSVAMKPMPASPPPP
ncbi:MAG: DUF3261 domain-containing protein [Bacillota bacterium]